MTVEDQLARAKADSRPRRFPMPNTIEGIRAFLLQHHMDNLREAQTRMILEGLDPDQIDAYADFLLHEQIPAMLEEGMRMIVAFVDAARKARDVT
jgi:hypothetical protein